MKNVLYIDVDTDRKDPGPVLIGKPEKDFEKPKTTKDHQQMVLDDMACLCEAVCTLIHLAEDQKIRPSPESLRICIKHLTDGFADSDYVTEDRTQNPIAITASPKEKK